MAGRRRRASKISRIPSYEISEHDRAKFEDTLSRTNLLLEATRKDSQYARFWDDMFSIAIGILLVCGGGVGIGDIVANGFTWLQNLPTVLFLLAAILDRIHSRYDLDVRANNDKRLQLLCWRLSKRIKRVLDADSALNLANWIDDDFDTAKLISMLDSHYCSCMGGGDDNPYEASPRSSH